MHTNNLEHRLGTRLLPLLHLGELPEGLDRRGDLGAPRDGLGRTLDVVEELLDEDEGGRVGERALAAAEPGPDACFFRPWLRTRASPWRRTRPSFPGWSWPS